MDVEHKIHARHGRKPTRRTNPLELRRNISALGMLTSQWQQVKALEKNVVFLR